MTTSGHFQHPCKCTNCGLHFVALSWYEGWPQDDEQMSQENLNNPVCPQCGSNKLMRWQPLHLESNIFEVVPGQQPLRSMGPVEEEVA